MIKLFIQGIHDGEHEINLSVPVSDIEVIASEFFGNIELALKIKKIGKRYSITGSATCKAKLICDRTLEEFDEIITVDIAVSVLADSQLFKTVKSDYLAENEGKIIHEDDKDIDLTDEVCELLTLGLPMKRVAPKYRDVEFEDMYPEFAKGKVSESESLSSDIIDDRWGPLKKLKMN